MIQPSMYTTNPYNRVISNSLRPYGSMPQNNVRRFTTEDTLANGINYQIPLSGVRLL